MPGRRDVPPACWDDCRRWTVSMGALPEGPGRRLFPTSLPAEAELQPGQEATSSGRRRWKRTGKLQGQAMVDTAPAGANGEVAFAPSLTCAQTGCVEPLDQRLTSAGYARDESAEANVAQIAANRRDFGHLLRSGLCSESTCHGMAAGRNPDGDKTWNALARWFRQPAC